MPQLLPGFVFIRRIGAGGMGLVYLAKELSPERFVAIKVLPPGMVNDPRRLSAFQREADYAAKINDSAVLPIHAYHHVNGVPFLVMPYVDGSDLERIASDRIKHRSEGPHGGFHPWAGLPDAAYLSKVLPVLDRLVKALKATHAEGIIHRDIKPSNVLVSRVSGDVWLTDFGLARLGREIGLTQPGTVAGSLGYMSPEQWDARGRIDGRSDIFSLGATIYRLLTLQLPYGTSIVSFETPPPKPLIKLQPLVSRDLGEIIGHALEPRPEDRFRDIEEFAACWEAARQGLTPPLRQYPWTRRAVRFGRRHRWPIATFTMMVGLALTALTVSFGRWINPPEAPRTDLRKVRVETNPPGARAVLVPRNPASGGPDPGRAIHSKPGQRTPLILEAPPGLYVVEAEIPGYGFQQVDRIVPEEGIDKAGGYRHQDWEDNKDGSITLPTIKIFDDADVTKEMVSVPGTVLHTVSSPKPFPTPDEIAWKVSIPAFYIDDVEVSTEKYGRVLRGFHSPGALAQTPANFPVVGIRYHDAIMYAEEVGKRLPGEEELDYLATCNNRTIFPWGDEPMPWLGTWTYGSSGTSVTCGISVLSTNFLANWGLGPVGTPAEDVTRASPGGRPIYGLFSNAAEMTSSWLSGHPMAPKDETLRPLRIARGGPRDLIEHGLFRVPCQQNGPCVRYTIKQAETNHLGLGFRLARSASPVYLKPEPAGPTGVKGARD